jgi:hypothetical protein
MSTEFGQPMLTAAAGSGILSVKTNIPERFPIPSRTGKSPGQR